MRVRATESLYDRPFYPWIATVIQGLTYSVQGGCNLCLRSDQDGAYELDDEEKLPHYYPVSERFPLIPPFDICYLPLNRNANPRGTRLAL